MQLLFGIAFENLTTSIQTLYRRIHVRYFTIFRNLQQHVTVKNNGTIFLVKRDF